MTFQNRIVSLVFIVGLLQVASLPACAEPEIKFPIVFTSLADVEQIGISLDWFDEKPVGDPDANAPDPRTEPLKPPAFPHGCYWQGATLYLISVSEEFLNEAKARGFTRESLCMGLVSNTLYDPETGERLPTYILRDERALQKHLDGLEGELNKPGSYALGFRSKAAARNAINQLRTGTLTNLTDEQAEALSLGMFFSGELPLRLPDCFKNGTPMLDCNWRYGRQTGRRLSDQAPLRYREVGTILDTEIRKALAEGRGQRVNTGDFYRADLENGSYLMIDRFLALDAEGDASPNGLNVAALNPLLDWADSLAWYAVSPNLPRGYGYALDSMADGVGDGGFTASSVVMANDRERLSSSGVVARVKRAIFNRK